MKAYVLHDINDLRFEEVARPLLQAHSVLVRVEAVGICGSDIPRIFYHGAHRMPLIPGHEFAGTVVDVGSAIGLGNRAEAGAGKSTGAGVQSAGKSAAKSAGNSGWLGKRVGIFPLIPCMSCPQCLKKQYEMCKKYDYLGSRSDGGFAEYVAVPEWNLLELPEQVSFEQAAMLEPASVAMHAIRSIAVASGRGDSGETAGIGAETTVAVCGLGTIGLLVAMQLKGMGVERVFVLGNKDAQRQMAARIGIEEACFCDTRKEDAKRWIMDQTDGAGVDVFFECIGKTEIVELGLEAAAAGGCVMLVGNPASDVALKRDVYWQILRKQLTVKGTWNSSFWHAEDDDWNLVLRAIKEGRIHPEELITHRFALQELYKGMEIMRDKSEDYVKIMAVR